MSDPFQPTGGVPGIPASVFGGLYTVNGNPNPVFPVKLTAATGGLYSWTEQRSTGSDYAGWQNLPGGRTGTNTRAPAFEPNDVAIDVTSHPVVFLQRAYYDATLDWVYVIVGGEGGGGFASSGTTAVFAPSTNIASGSTVVEPLNSTPVLSFGPNPPTISSPSLVAAVSGYYLCTVNFYCGYTASGGFLPTMGELAVKVPNGLGLGIWQSYTIPASVSGAFGLQSTSLISMSGVVVMIAGGGLDVVSVNSSDVTWPAAVRSGSFSLVQIS
jgi:hypothetical protein